MNIKVPAAITLFKNEGDFKGISVSLAAHKISSQGEKSASILSSYFVTF